MKVPCLVALLLLAAPDHKSMVLGATIDAYPDCHVHDPGAIGDGVCWGMNYNTAECGWDGGDCIAEGYPDCHVEHPNWIGDGHCFHLYDNAECGWDGGDCLMPIDDYPDCDADHQDWIGDGSCFGAYNTAECGWDGGDCDGENEVLWETYPECQGGVDDLLKPSGVSPGAIGDGRCDGGFHNTAECGWDGGDCIESNKLAPPPGWPGNTGNTVSPQDTTGAPRVDSDEGEDNAVPISDQDDPNKAGIVMASPFTFAMTIGFSTVAIPTIICALI